MRLSFSVHGETVVSTLELGTLSFKRTRPFPGERVAQLSREVVGVLARGNRASHLSESNLRNLRQVGEQLFALLVPQDLAAKLRGSERAVYLQVDEALVTVPWELLHDEECFWCQRYDLGRAVTTPQAMVGRAAPLPSVGPLRMLVICANARGDLPQVMAEGQALVERLDRVPSVEVHLVVDPPLESVRRLLKEHDLVHFAGHGDHDPAHPEQGGWHLRDGKLTAAEVLNLSGGRAMPLLVFSNACRSGQTEAWLESDQPSHVYGLANAFLLGGVRLYLGTQWEVVDGQSAEFATSFYEALARGASAGAAVRLARDAILQSKGASAMAWASYVLYGDPTVTPVRRTELATTASELPSPSMLEARASAPWKRPVSGGSRPPLTRPPLEPERRTLLGRLPWWAWLSLGAALVAVGAVGTWVYLRAGGARLSIHEAGPGLELVEGAVSARAKPLVAILLAARDPLRACLERQLAGSHGFRPVEAERVTTLATNERLDLAAALATKEGVRLGRALGAELALFRRAAPGGAKLSVADVLSGELPVEGPGGEAEAQCAALVQELLRVVHGEGLVLAVEGASVTLNLGWKSRIAPGQRLEVWRNGRRVGALRVERVELDRSIATGAARLGDQVRRAP